MTLKYKVRKDNASSTPSYCMEDESKYYPLFWRIPNVFKDFSVSTVPI